ncbi:hypothetical protein AB0E69_11830 [Kribbella sp. NPDC026611]|uniref:hypothetical protein n=1 Tax=Kribbella sp. NPDC026611 TaxID=3154911 RepID=UPI0033F3EA28
MSSIKKKRRKNKAPEARPLIGITELLLLVTLVGGGVLRPGAPPSADVPCSVTAVTCVYPD